jgi:hypothetical protein
VIIIDVGFVRLGHCQWSSMYRMLMLPVSYHFLLLVALLPHDGLADVSHDPEVVCAYAYGCVFVFSYLDGKGKGWRCCEETSNKSKQGKAVKVEWCAAFSPTLPRL